MQALSALKIVENMNMNEIMQSTITESWDNGE